MSIRVLVVDDEVGVRYTIREILESVGYGVTEAKDGVEALEKIRTQGFDLVISDLRMPRLDGLGLLRELQKEPRSPRVVMVTAHGTERTAVEAMKAGAWDYFHKPFEVEELLGVVERSTETLRLLQENERLSGERALGRTMVFASSLMSRLAVLVQRVAPRDVTVLITGESGTGKERVAEAIVGASGRAEKPFVRFNCASLGSELAEAELFGHAKGAFTGAFRARVGLFGEADGGTLLLDEVGELDLGLQARLLRVLQDGEVRSVGEERSKRVDVRILAATHRDLREMVGQKKFREDLFYRLNVVNLRVPALRERPEDIPVLVRAFVGVYGERFGVGPVRVSDGLLARFIGYSWPGNVRELLHTVESMVALSQDGELDVNLFPTQGGGGVLGLRERVEAYERGLIVEALSRCGGSQAEVARRLGIPRVTLHDKLKKYGLDVER